MDVHQNVINEINVTDQFTKDVNNVPKEQSASAGIDYSKYLENEKAPAVGVGSGAAERDEKKMTPAQTDEAARKYTEAPDKDE